MVLTQLEIPVTAAEEALSRGRVNGAITILNPAPVRPLAPSVLQFVDVLPPTRPKRKFSPDEIRMSELIPRI